jgi:hypothetical protein
MRMAAAAVEGLMVVLGISRVSESRLPSVLCHRHGNQQQKQQQEEAVEEEISL